MVVAEVPSMADWNLSDRAAAAAAAHGQICGRSTVTAAVTDARRPRVAPPDGDGSADLWKWK
jgi:hypothetical protein